MYNGGQELVPVDNSAAQAIDEIRLACLLTGSRTPADLPSAVKLGPELREWLP